MPWGGKQMLGAHKHLGGYRVIDAMGPDPRSIEWNGLFYGPSATVRARAVDAMKDAGGQVQLSWGSFTYTVVIEDFNPEYKHEWEVKYHISCMIVSQGSGTTSPNLDTQINSDISAIDAISTPAVGVPPAIAMTIPTAVSTAVETLDTAVETVALAQPTRLIQDATLKAVQAAVLAAQTAQAVSQAAQIAADGAMVGINLDALTVTSVADGNVIFVAEQNNQAAGSDLMTVTAYVGRIAANLMLTGG
jgi:hypothetical protein